MDVIKIRIFLLAAALMATLAACGPKEPEIDPDMIYTQVAATVAVQMVYTQVAATMIAGAAQTVQAQATPIPPSTALPTQAPPTPALVLPVVPDTATPEPGVGDEVLDKAFLISQRPGDGQRFNPGSSFDAEWIFQNIGATTWNANYSIRWKGYGPRYGAEGSYSFATNADNLTVAPGETVTITLFGLRAPGGDGVHIAPFCLYNSRLEQELPDQCFFNTTIEVYIGPE